MPTQPLLLFFLAGSLGVAALMQLVTACFAPEHGTAVPVRPLGPFLRAAGANP